MPSSDYRRRLRNRIYDARRREQRNIQNNRANLVDVDDNAQPLRNDAILPRGYGQRIQ